MLRQENCETIQIQKEGAVAVLTLNRPERLNAVNGAMHSELMSIFLDVQADTDVRAAVLTGAGRAFCAGGDFGAPYAVQSSKTSVNKFIKMVSNLVLPVSLALEEVSMTKKDHREAVLAFQEKRDPKFTGE